MKGFKKNKQGRKSTWDFLNTPIDMESIADVLTKDVTQVFKISNPGLMPNLDQKADNILDEAENLARQEGIPLDEALERLGITLDDSEDEESKESKGLLKDAMLKSMDWEVSEEEQLTGETSLSDTQMVKASKVVNEFYEYLSELEEDVLEELTGNVSPDDVLLLKRLKMLDIIDERQFEAAVSKAEKDSVPFWEALTFQCRDDIPGFVDILLTMPFAPIFVHEKGVFVEWLLDNNHLNFKMFKKARQESLETGISTCQLLDSDEYLGEEKYLEALSEFVDLPPWKNALPKPTPSLANTIDSDWIELFNVIPLKATKTKIDLGLTCPISQRLVEKLGKNLSKEVNLFLISHKTVEALKEPLLKKVEREMPKPEKRVVEASARIQKIVTSASAVNMVRQILEGALDARATDIHLEPQKENTRVRFRIDGMLYEVLQLQKSLYNEISSRIKIVADLDVTERRRPQDGHLNVNIGGNQFDMRIATVPNKYGEKISIRLVYAGRINKNLSELGLEKEDYQKVLGFCSRPHGMILATGPVGSGKTTTLYSCLNEIDRNQYNVMSIEDPVEFELPGANQVEVNYNLNFGFIQGLRALLRQDPDTILIGEIRDDETAGIAVRASMTGLLVFSTLHTNDAPGAITALYNFRLPTHLIANSLVGVIGQRLLRKICTECRTAYKPKAAEKKSVGFKPAQAQKIKEFYHGAGCSHCFNSGYFDRTGVFEVMEVTPKLKEMILAQKSEAELRAQAISDGMRTLSESGRSKILEGETTTEEYLRLLGF